MGGAAAAAAGITSEYVRLSNGISHPAGGIGTYLARGAEVANAVLWAIKAGVRHIDTAVIYRNEEAIAKAVQQAGVPRSDLFITSKISPREMGADRAGEAFDANLARLNTDYIDCMLIHWPGTSGQPPDSPKHSQARMETWRVLENRYKAGKARAIGVSNFEVRHLMELQQHCEIPPMINQIGVHPKLQQRQLRDFCRQHEIHVVAYASLGTGELLSDPTVTSVARDLNRTPAQVLLKWGLQSGCLVIPKSVHQERIQAATWQQLSGWQLPGSCMAALDALQDGTKYCWDPASIA